MLIGLLGFLRHTPPPHPPPSACPACTGAGIAYEEAVSNPNLMLAVTEHGGHLGWCDKQPAGEGPKWIERVCLDFFDAIAAP